MKKQSNQTEAIVVTGVTPTAASKKNRLKRHLCDDLNDENDEKKLKSVDEDVDDKGVARAQLKN